jgi:transcriptional regulator with XRE-family HTH domain
MWLDNLKELKKKTNMTNKQIAIKSNLPEKTICRIFAGDTKNPYIDTLNAIALALDSTLTDILADTKVRVGNESLVELQENVEVAQAEKDLLLVDYNILKEKYDALTKELELTKNELMYTKKLLAVHEYYTKLKSE